MKHWHFSQRGIFGLLLCFFLGLMHMIFEAAAMANTEQSRWTLLGFDIDSPGWFLVPWFTIGTLFFFWAGWFFPAQERKRALEYRSAFSQPGE